MMDVTVAETVASATPLAELQQAVQQWADEHWNGDYWPPLANLARLTEEVGELARALNQMDGHKRLKPGEAPADVAQEIADVLFVLLCLANSTGVDGQAAWEATLARSHARARQARGIDTSEDGQSDTN